MKSVSADLLSLISFKLKKSLVWKCSTCAKGFKFSEHIIYNAGENKKYHYSCFPLRGSTGIEVK